MLASPLNLQPRVGKRRKRCGGVHHGPAVLRATLLAIARQDGSIAAAANEKASTLSQRQRLDARGRWRAGELSSLVGDVAVLVRVLGFVGARDLARLEATSAAFVARSPSLGAGLCEYAARLWLDRLGRPASTSSMLSLHLATSRVVMTALRRRGSQRLSSLRAAAALARRIFAPPSTPQPGFPMVSEAHLVALGATVTDGVFVADNAAAAPPPRVDGDTQVLEMTRREARALGLGTRSIDQGHVGECVVEFVPESVRNDSRIRADGCWILRRADGQRCWSASAFAQHLDDRAKDAVHLLEFERAYDRRELFLALDTPADKIVAKAKHAYAVPQHTDAALFTLSGSPNACWTQDDDRSTLADLGLQPGDSLTSLLCLLPPIAAAL